MRGTKNSRRKLTQENSATSRKHLHIHGKVFLPPIPDISPAEYRRRHMGKKDKN